MPQQKSTSLTMAKAANFGVVIAQMIGKISEMEKEIKRLYIVFLYFPRGITR